MQSETAGTEARNRATRSNPVLKKIWLPKGAYDALPFFYIVSGIAALLTTLYITNWMWIIPHYLLFSVACVHFGVLIFRRRRRREEP